MRRSYYHKLLCQPLDEILVGASEGFVVGVIQGGFWLAFGTEILVDPVRFRLEDPDAAAVEPISTTLAADIEPAESERVKYRDDLADIDRRRSTGATKTQQKCDDLKAGQVAQDHELGSNL